jgi:hypothetical protein
LVIAVVENIGGKPMVHNAAWGWIKAHGILSTNPHRYREARSFEILVIGDDLRNGLCQHDEHLN